MSAPTYLRNDSWPLDDLRSNYDTPLQAYRSLQSDNEDLVDEIKELEMKIGALSKNDDSKLITDLTDQNEMLLADLKAQKAHEDQLLQDKESAIEKYVELSTAPLRQNNAELREKASRLANEVTA
jgi:hypothetical protein